MGSDIFGGLVKGLGAFMPKDDPDVRLFQVHTEVSELENRRKELYAEIGKKEFDKIKELPEYNDLVMELNLNDKKIQNAKSKLNQAQNEKAEKEKSEKEKFESCICPNCYTVNPEGVKFCQDCGTKLTPPAEQKCPSCGEPFQSGAHFCGACGGRL
ncbi:zinc ribbon domain-containing protein [Sinanaerobacter chloroacetimidivorans]|uniref:Zinc ribbon domain-containing protein n=1 Tax=Sinanaerobacter chloroacetimidivorans TaxID=2818044 RepID=A0A8J8B475_9FIRM|nr:zinc ribbon domain-containing protein [Sinanaerobacter chloroacetimidivorans]MBR0599065.1 zinc ribbon domain-containing protein [Sinanaerobacter chloroacetimidivorans]